MPNKKHLIGLRLDKTAYEVISTFAKAMDWSVAKTAEQLMIIGAENWINKIDERMKRNGQKLAGSIISLQEKANKNRPRI